MVTMATVTLQAVGMLLGARPFWSCYVLRKSPFYFESLALFQTAQSAGTQAELKL